MNVSNGIYGDQKALWPSFRQTLVRRTITYFCLPSVWWNIFDESGQVWSMLCRFGRVGSRNLEFGSTSTSGTVYSECASSRGLKTNCYAELTVSSPVPIAPIYTEMLVPRPACDDNCWRSLTTRRR